MREWQLLCKKQAQRSQKSAATLSKISPERQVFEKIGVEIPHENCCGHLDMTPRSDVWWSAVLYRGEGAAPTKKALKPTSSGRINRRFERLYPHLPSFETIK
jgi:hypothetical protein